MRNYSDIDVVLIAFAAVAFFIISISLLLQL